MLLQGCGLGEHTRSLVTTGENPWAPSRLRDTSPYHRAASATLGWLPRRQLVSHHRLVHVPRVSHALGLPSPPLQSGRARGSGGHRVCQGEDNFFQLLVAAKPVSSPPITLDDSELSFESVSALLSVVTHGLVTQLLGDEHALRLGTPVASAERPFMASFVPFIPIALTLLTSLLPAASVPRYPKPRASPQLCAEAGEMRCALRGRGPAGALLLGQTPTARGRLLSTGCWRAGPETDAPCTFPGGRWDAESAKERSSSAPTSSR